MLGKVENIKYTFGGLGNQITTIDGKAYMTWFDLMKYPVKVGSIVEYSVQLNAEVSHSPAIRADVAVISKVL